MVVDRVEIDGLDEFRRALRKVGPELPKQMRAGMRQYVADPIADEIKAGVPRVSGDWAKQIRGGATQRSAYVQWGRTLVYPPLLEFAAKWGGVPGVGRYVYPVVDRNREKAARAAERVLAATFRRAQLALD